MRNPRKDVSFMQSAFILVNVGGMIWSIYHASEVNGWAKVPAFAPWLMHFVLLFLYERLPLHCAYEDDEYTEGMEFGYEAGRLVQGMEAEQSQITMRVYSRDIPALQVYADRYAYGIEVLHGEGAHSLIRAHPQMEHLHGPWG